eukprot:896793-Amphidinium_carterae.2
MSGCNIVVLVSPILTAFVHGVPRRETSHDNQAQQTVDHAAKIESNTRGQLICLAKSDIGSVPLNTFAGLPHAELVIPLPWVAPKS